jgi:hypothetical protein
MMNLKSSDDSLMGAIVVRMCERKKNLVVLDVMIVSRELKVTRDLEWTGGGEVNERYQDRERGNGEV